MSSSHSSFSSSSSAETAGAYEDGYGGSSAVSLHALLSRGSRVLHAYLDRTTLYLKTRWIIFFLLLLLYIWRVWWLQGFFVVTYGLGIYLLNLLIGFISPQVDPETEELVLPVTNETGEYRPFQRQLLEFKCWTAGMRAVLLSLLLTCFSVFDLPVFWPILLVYFLLLFFLTMKQQIKRMIKYKYLPFSWGKQTYGDITRGKPTAAGGSSSTAANSTAAAKTAAASNIAAAPKTAGSCYLKPQQFQQHRNNLYYPRPAGSTATPPAAGPMSSSSAAAATSPPASTAAAPAPAAPAASAAATSFSTATAFTAADHFNTPYVLR